MSRWVLWPTRLRTRRTKLAAAAGQLEADQVGAEQALEDLAAPRQLGEQLGGRERDVEVEADPQVGPLRAQHLRHQLELVVLHPDGRALGRHLGGPVGEALVDPDVGLPPLAVELRLGDEVVVERPERAVGEALVELLHLLRAQRHRAPATTRPRRTARTSSSSADPGQPIHAPSLARITGSSAVTSPPGERRHDAEPSGRITRSTGSRLATITRSACGVGLTRATLSRLETRRPPRSVPPGVWGLRGFVQTTRRRRMTSLWFVA